MKSCGEGDSLLMGPIRAVITAATSRPAVADPATGKAASDACETFVLPKLRDMGAS
jgi:hypothetical protein